jgi:hypothetical protein
MVGFMESSFSSSIPLVWAWYVSIVKKLVKGSFRREKVWARSPGLFDREADHSLRQMRLNWWYICTGNSRSYKTRCSRLRRGG